MEFGDLSDNPFSAHPAPKRTRRRTVTSALKFLLLVAACLAVTLVVGNHSQKWLVHQLTHDFDDLGSEEKQQRLMSLARLGQGAIDPIVQSIRDDDIEVAERAYRILRQCQNDWTVLQRDEQQARHEALVDSLRSIAVYLPDDRTGWGTSLLQQTLMTTIDRRDDGSRQLYSNATRAMEMFSLSQRAGPSVLSDEPLDPKSPRRLVVKTNPLPVASAESMDEWTDWPPPQEPLPMTATSVSIVSKPQLVDESDSEPVLIQPAMQSQPAVAEDQESPSPSVYRSTGTRLKPVQEDEPVILRDISQSESPRSEPARIQPVTYLVDSPMETFDDKSVVHWLASPNRALRDKARLELISRGFDGTELAIATQLATGNVASRIELIDSIARSASVDPRPWLVMMLDDESRDVKLRVISILATMKDSDVDQRLRLRLVDERDPTVAARIRRILDLR